MRRNLLNLAICLAAFILGTVAAIVFFTSENGNDVLSQSPHQYELKSESPTNNAPVIKSESRYPIIEIWEELDGSVPIRGQSLYFRLYDDGVVEFDYVLRKRTYTDGTVEFEYEPRKEPILPPRQTKSVEFSLERMPPTKISEEEFRKFKSLLEYLTKSKDIKQEYKPVGLTLDVITKLTILLKENDTTERKIIINDADYDVTYKKYEKRFPNLLVNLIKEVHLMRVKLQEKEGSKNLSFESD